jgi:predicted nucleic acid-binding protein
MILVDIRVIVAWLDPRHPAHTGCARALAACAKVDEVAISTLTLAELAGSGRREKDLREDLKGFVVVGLDNETALRAGQELSHQSTCRRVAGWLLSDSILWSHAVQLKASILALQHHGLRHFRNVNILVPDREKQA